MAKISKEFRIGIAFILAIFVLYYGISYLKGINIFKQTNSYMVVFDDVTGLGISAPVKVNGLKIGVVHAMEMDPNNTRRVLVYLDMDKGVQIPVNSTLTMDVSMMGGSTLILAPGSHTDGLISSSDTIIGIRKRGLMDAADDLAPQINGMMPKVDSILVGLQALVNSPALGTTITNLDQTMANINNITSDLAKATKQLNTTMTTLNRDVPKITSNLATTTDKLNEMDIASTYQSIDATMKNIELLSTKLNTRDNSLGLLLNDRQLYDSINTTLNNASLLLKDVKENPKKYINVKLF